MHSIQEFCMHDVQEHVLHVWVFKRAQPILYFFSDPNQYQYLRVKSFFMIKILRALCRTFTAGKINYSELSAGQTM